MYRWWTEIYQRANFMVLHIFVKGGCYNKLKKSVKRMESIWVCARKQVSRIADGKRLWEKQQGDKSD